MPLWVIIVLVVGEMAVAAVIVGAIVHGTLGGLSKRHPAAPIDSDAVRRDFQSFKIGLLNMGWSMHVAVDAGHLHLIPALFFRVIGAKPASIPWESVEPLDHPGKRYRRAKIGGEEMRCPGWCLEIADAPGGLG